MVGTKPQWLTGATAKAEDVAKAINERKSTVILFYDSSAANHHPNDSSTKLGDVWGAANLKKEFEFVTETDVSKHPTFLKDVQSELERKGVAVSLPTTLSELPVTVLVRGVDRGVKLVPSADHLQTVSQYVSSIHTFLEPEPAQPVAAKKAATRGRLMSAPMPAPVVAPPPVPPKYKNTYEAPPPLEDAPPPLEDAPEQQPNYSARFDGGDSAKAEVHVQLPNHISIDEIRKIADQLNAHTEKVNEIIEHLAAGEKLAIRFTLHSCPACNNCLAEVWNHASKPFAEELHSHGVVVVPVELKNGSGSEERAFINGLAAAAGIDSPMNYFPALVMLKLNLAESTLKIRLHTGYAGNCASYVKNVYEQLELID